MPLNHVDRLLDRLPDASAARAARWLLWSLIARRLVLATALAASLVLHQMQ